jgi:hypothetical protein
MFSNDPNLGGLATPQERGTAKGTFGSAERFCIGGIYWDDAKNILPPSAKLLIRKFVAMMKIHTGHEHLTEEERLEKLNEAERPIAERMEQRRQVRPPAALHCGSTAARKASCAPPPPPPPDSPQNGMAAG